jgi:hypothetical protein
MICFRKLRPPTSVVSSSTPDADATVRLVQEASGQVDDMKGVKFHRGLAVDLTPEGRGGVPLPGSEIVPALDRGLTMRPVQQRPSDRRWAFPTCQNCMLQSHQSTEQLGLVQQGWYTRSASSRRSSTTVRAGRSAGMSWKGDRSQFEGLHRVKKAVSTSSRRLTPSCATSSSPGTRYDRSRPKPVQEGARQPEGLRASAARQNDYLVDFKMAWNHYFGRKG